MKLEVSSNDVQALELAGMMGSYIQPFQRAFALRESL